MKSTTLIAFSVLMMLLPACEQLKVQNPRGTGAKATKTAVKKTEEKVKTHAYHNVDPAPPKAASGGCGSCAGAGPVAHAGQRKEGDATLVGAALTGAPTAKVVALMKAPAEFEGKLVALRGSVAAMCHHRKLWFSMVDDDSGRQLRVITHPAFLTPGGSIGRKVLVEGIVEKIEIPAARARHIAKEHGTADPSKIKGDVHHEAVLRAKGAKFF